MIQRITTGALAGLLAFALTAHAQSATAKTALQAAIHLELIQGDLSKAIDEFKKLANDKDPAIAAEALVHLAACYDKLGQPEARATYQRVVRDYPNQNASKVARAWLNAHAQTTAAATGMSLEKISSVSDIHFDPRVSPDGRFLTFADWSTGWGNLAIRDLKAGTTRLLTRDATSRSWVGDESIVSPDGRVVAYRMEGKDNSIRVIGTDGSGMRIVATRQYGDELAGWSPDGKQLAVHHWNGADATHQILLMSVATGSVTPLKSTGWRWPDIGGFSPDGRFLIYALQKEPNGPFVSDVLALAVDASRETAVMQEARNSASPRWTSDGRVLFVSNESGTPGIWSMQVVDGRPQGDPVLLKPNVGRIKPIGVTSDGSYHYTSVQGTREAYIADLDSKSLTVSRPVLVTNQWVGSNYNPQVSPDGKWVAFLRATPGAGTPQPPTLILRSVVTGEERTLDERGGYGQPSWFPDSRALLLQVRGEAGRALFRKVGLDPTETRNLFEAPEQVLQVVWNTAALSADGRSLFFTVAEVIDGRSGPGDPKALKLVNRSLETGEERILHEVQSRGFGLFGLSVSPDGKQLAFQVNVQADQRAVLVMQATGGSPKEIYRTSGDALSHTGAMGWTRDGRYLVLTGKCGPTPGDQLCALPIDGGSLVSLGIRMEAIPHRMVSADGRRIAFTGSAQQTELWAIRNMLGDATKR